MWIPRTTDLYFRKLAGKHVYKPLYASLSLSLSLFLACMAHTNKWMGHKGVIVLEPKLFIALSLFKDVVKRVVDGFFVFLLLFLLYTYHSLAREKRTNLYWRFFYLEIKKKKFFEVSDFREKINVQYLCLNIAVLFLHQRSCIPYKKKQKKCVD